jgi:hypothetical protein
MNTNYLLPHAFKKAGWIITLALIIPSMYCIISPDFKWIENLLKSMGIQGLLPTICLVGMVIGLLFVSFAKEKSEDEYITKIRLESLVWAVWGNYVLLAVASLVIYDMNYLYVMVFGLYTVLVLFIAKFNVALYKLRKQGNHEE